MVSFAVDQQTTLVESNEKPNVTPQMLGAWVGFLLASGDTDCTAIGEKVGAACCERLRHLAPPPYLPAGA